MLGVDGFVCSSAAHPRHSRMVSKIEPLDSKHIIAYYRLEAMCMASHYFDPGTNVVSHEIYYEYHVMDVCHHTRH